MAGHSCEYRTVLENFARQILCHGIRVRATRDLRRFVSKNEAVMWKTIHHSQVHVVSATTWTWGSDSFCPDMEAMIWIHWILIKHFVLTHQLHLYIPGFFFHINIIGKILFKVNTHIHDNLVKKSFNLKIYV